MNIDDLTLGQIKQLQGLGATASHWEVGKAYFIRTATYHCIGRLVAVTDHELVLEDAAWVADSGRFGACLSEGTVSEAEPFPTGRVLVGRGALIDAAVWEHPLIREAQ